MVEEAGCLYCCCCLAILSDFLGHRVPAAAAAFAAVELSCNQNNCELCNTMFVVCIVCTQVVSSLQFIILENTKHFIRII